MDVWSPTTPFCKFCGTLMVHPDLGSIVCDKCGFSCKVEGQYIIMGWVKIVSKRLSHFPDSFYIKKDLGNLLTVTHSTPKPVPTWLMEYRATQAIAQGGSAPLPEGPLRSVVSEECPKCKNPMMEYYTLQLRSADEGQTVFYECRKCGHKFSVNT